jgi:hypothetical protein
LAAGKKADAEAKRARKQKIDFIMVTGCFQELQRKSELQA